MPRLAHGFVFVKELAAVVRFYEQAFGFVARRTPDAGFVVMEPAGGGAGVALHELPERIKALVHLTSPPRWRDDTAYKLCFETDDLEATRAAVLAAGGLAKEPWTWEGTRYCECTDPEGNVVQLFARGG